MPKLRSTPISAADLEKYLSTDDDFAFELRCLHSLSERPIKLEHGGTYTDPVSGKTRQFDIRAMVEADPLRVSFAIECKNLSASYPLLVSRVPRSTVESFHHLLIPEEREEESGDQLYRVTVPRITWSKSVTINSPASLYEADQYVGKSVTRVGIAATQASSQTPEFVADDSEVFDRWSQAVASAYDLISEADSYFHDEDAVPCAYWIVPILVVPQGTLWVADYDNKGSLLRRPALADEVEIYLDHSAWQKGQMFSYTISHLHFVTPQGLLRLIDRVLVNDHFKRKILPKEQPTEEET